jgi:predicted RNase H-like nuclease (RuvC/YqgF family)
LRSQLEGLNSLIVEKGGEVKNLRQEIQQLDGILDAKDAEINNLTSEMSLQKTSI